MWSLSWVSCECGDGSCASVDRGNGGRLLQGALARNSEGKQLGRVCCSMVALFYIDYLQVNHKSNARCYVCVWSPSET